MNVKRTARNGLACLDLDDLARRSERGADLFELTRHFSYQADSARASVSALSVSRLTIALIGR